MKVKAIIEAGKKPAFDINMEYREDLPFGILGQGDTLEEAKVDFINSYNEMIDLFEEQGRTFPPIEFEYLFDTASFLRYISGTFTMSGLSKITGINRKQLGHYIQGVSKPRPQTAARIQRDVLAYLEELTKIRFYSR